MKPKQRKSEIVSRVERYGQVTVDGLAGDFGVSAETIRRDLSDLAEAGLLLKVHGGARRRRLDAEGSFAQRMAENADAKACIAEKLVGMIPAGATLFVDTGSTTLAAAHALGGVGGVTVITNSARIAAALGDRAAVHLLGGQWRSDNAQTVGAQAIEQIATFRADHAVLTVGAIDAEGGAADYNLEEADVARAMIAHADQVIVLADRSKIGRRAPFVVCPASCVDLLITDGAVAPSVRAAFDTAGTRIL